MMSKPGNTRRAFLLQAGMGAALLGAQEPQNIVVPQTLPPIKPNAPRSTVSLVTGDNRRRMIREALAALDPKLRTAISHKKYVLIKANLTSVTNQLASTHPEMLCGIMDYLAPWFKGPVVIAEAASGDTQTGFDNFGYAKVVSEFKTRRVSLVCLNEEQKFVTMGMASRTLYVNSVRMAARLFDKDAFMVSATSLKTHDSVVATLSLKNMAQGAPLHAPRNVTPRWDDKRRLHDGDSHHMNYNLMRMAQTLSPYWGVGLIDGYDGMEGDGPLNGTAVPSRVALASLDHVAADRVGVELMGINPQWMGYLRFSEQMGLGNYDLAKIDVIGEKIDKFKRTYKLPRTIQRQLLWLGPLA
jgi:uncharacterized protein (DUF362 family)